ncbi:MAG: aspartate kinase [Pseudomonadota bacterium]
MKFGGTSVAGVERIRNAAAKVIREIENGFDVAVLVSAMAGETNKLVAFVDEAARVTGPTPENDAPAPNIAAADAPVPADAADPFDPCEYDAVVSSGEQVTSGLMALVLRRLGAPARSWQGWQIPVRTSAVHGAARILSIDTTALEDHFRAGYHAVAAGFQGIGPDGRIATLGRGGSDTSAVALAAALGAVRCDIYTDVDAVYTTDPRIEPSARRIDQITYEEMLELASLGAKVLQTRSVELAMRYAMPVQVLSSFDAAVGSETPGTMVCGEEEVMRRNREAQVESAEVTGVAYQREEAKITVARVPDRPGVAASVFGPLAEASVNVDMIVQNISDDGRTDMTFTVALADCDRAIAAIEAARDVIGYTQIKSDRSVAKVSIVGLGMRSHAGVAQKMFQRLADEGVNIQVISTSEIKVSVLIDRKYMELAVRTLHSAFDLATETTEADAPSAARPGSAPGGDATHKPT